MLDENYTNNSHYLLNMGVVKYKEDNNLPINTEYNDECRSNSIDSGRGSDLNNLSHLNSGKESILHSGHDKAGASRSRSIAIDSGHLYSNYFYAKKRTSIEVIDSGISSPLTAENLDFFKKQRRASSKTEAEYERSELAENKYLPGRNNSRFQNRSQKQFLGYQNNSGIGSIVNRIRSMSIGVASHSAHCSRRPSNENCFLSTLYMSPDQDIDPIINSDQNLNSGLNFIKKNVPSAKKWIRMTHSLSCDADSINSGRSKIPKCRYRSSFDAVNFPSVSPSMNKLESYLSGYIDTSTPNGALLAVINQGLRKVSESDRYLLISKSPLRSPVDFLDAGIEHLGDSDILITVLHHSTCYDLMPENSKLIVIDSTLPIQKAFSALDDNNVNSAPIWNSFDQSFMGVLSKENQMYLLLLAYEYREKSTDVDTYMKTISRESLFNCIGREPTRHQLQWVNPENTLCSVIKRLQISISTQVLVIDENHSGNALYILDHKRILTFLFSASQCGLPLPSVLKTMIGVTELMMNKKTLEKYKVYLDTNLATLLNVMDHNEHHCAIVCIEKLVCKSCLCTDECIGLLTVDDISLLISQSSHCDPLFTVESILNQTSQHQRSMVCCDERESVMNVVESIVEEKTPFILINRDCCKNCIHSIVSSKELLNYIMKHDKCSTVRENALNLEKGKSKRSFSCCEENQKISDMNLIYETDETIVPPSEYL